MRPFFDCVTKMLLSDKKPPDMDCQEYIRGVNDSMGYSDNLKLKESDLSKNDESDELLSKAFKIGFNSISGMLV